MPEPREYEAWYHSARGRWISDREFQLMTDLLQPAPLCTLLDVGCGSGHFSRRFASIGLQVTGLDPDRAMLDYAARQDGAIDYVLGDALELPFADRSFDYVSAVTSLCFIANPQKAVEEMWRVCRKAVVLGLLNRRSLLYRIKHDSGGYRGARWDTVGEARMWVSQLAPTPADVQTGSVLLTPANNAAQRWMETLYPRRGHFGAFLALVFFRHGAAAQEPVSARDGKR